MANCSITLNMSNILTIYSLLTSCENFPFRTCVWTWNCLWHVVFRNNLLRRIDSTPFRGYGWGVTCVNVTSINDFLTESIGSFASPFWYRVFGGDRDGMGRNSPPFKQLVTLYLTFILLADFDSRRTDRPSSKTENGPCRTRSDSALLLNFIVPPGLAASLQLLLASSHTSLSSQFTVGKVSPVDLSVPSTVISNDQPAVNDNDFP